MAEIKRIIVQTIALIIRIIVQTICIHPENPDNPENPGSDFALIIRIIVQTIISTVCFCLSSLRGINNLSLLTPSTIIPESAPVLCRRIKVIL